MQPLRKGKKIMAKTRIRSEGGQKRRAMRDPVKEMLAAAVQHHMCTGEARPALHVQPDNVLNVTGVPISPTETMLRVVFRDETPTRYFRVILRESTDKI
jgi:hypothetical protein